MSGSSHVNHVVETDHAVGDRPLPAEERPAGAHAGGDLRDRAGEVVPGMGEGVDAGRVDHGVARDAQGVAAKLVGADEDDVGAVAQVP